jgi:hypothetical protein
LEIYLRVNKSPQTKLNDLLHAENMRLVIIKMQTSLFQATYICTNFDVRELQNINVSHEGEDGGGIGLSYKS